MIFTIFNCLINIHQINSQSLEDTQVGYIPQKYILDKYTFDKYTLEKYTLEQYTLEKYTLEKYTGKTHFGTKHFRNIHFVEEKLRKLRKNWEEEKLRKLLVHVRPNKVVFPFWLQQWQEIRGIARFWLQQFESITYVLHVPNGYPAVPKGYPMLPNMTWVGARVTCVSNTTYIKQWLTHLILKYQIGLGKNLAKQQPSRF